MAIQMVKKIIIGSRGSDLALWQARYVASALKKINIRSEVKIIKTKGDIIQNLSWDKMEGKGFFTKEIEDALLKKEIDLAVHSHKDLPTEASAQAGLPTETVNGLVIAAVSGREDPSEVLLINKNAVDEKQKFYLKQHAVVGTSSARRKSQMLAWRSDVKLTDLRGNVPTRVQKLRDGKYDAILIAYAGIARLQTDLSHFHCKKLDPKEFVPAPAQGVLALQIRKEDKGLYKKLQKLNHPEVKEITDIERKVLNLFQGGCQLPLGVYCGLTPHPSPKERGKSIYKVWVALAEKWDSFPMYFYFESKSPKRFAEKIFSKIKSAVASASFRKKEGRSMVFISRNEKKNDFFKRCLKANGYKVFCQSLIQIKQVPIKGYKKCDWVFFSSKNGVKHFFEQNPDVEGVRFGAIGKSTAEEIRKFGKEAVFTGDSADTGITGKKFASLVRGKSVLFPQTKSSIQSIQRQFSEKKNIFNLTVYETVKNHNFQLPTFNFLLLVFTSPSNVNAYFEKYKIQAGQKIIAIGNSTGKALKKQGIKIHAIAPSFDDVGLVQAVMKN